MPGALARSSVPLRSCPERRCSQPSGGSARALALLAKNNYNAEKQSASRRELRVTRTYGQFCGVARALEMVGERWALLIVRDLLVGPRRFTDLRRGLPRIPTNI